MSNKVISTDNSTVVIRINPQVESVVISDDGQEEKGPYHNTVFKGFLKIQPKPLGIVQIMIGVTIFLYGIVLNDSYLDRISVYSVITRWTSLTYITAGSLSVAAENKLHLCLVKASLGMNVLSAITAGINIILISIDITVLSSTGQHCVYNESDANDYDMPICLHFETLNHAVIGTFLVFSILLLIISVCISAFAYKATCGSDSNEDSVSLNQQVNYLVGGVIAKTMVTILFQQAILF
ncbi:membrane-spanning 4-domains subfamily A member 4A-like [Myxocyprinus asiaticus]|uniref:membrane-spanning 4-domains subfamily A member 4A-like n=1 Tax=Myxocyprinus asiaticus TaxID=70543 RepID=UPI0022227F78|nr:membrane-spanning 4-domains subfamily A member 4A-like [Myxocyprinus asiaticus]